MANLDGFVAAAFKRASFLGYAENFLSAVFPAIKTRYATKLTPKPTNHE